MSDVVVWPALGSLATDKVTVLLIPKLSREVSSVELDMIVPYFLRILPHSILTAIDNRAA